MVGSRPCSCECEPGRDPCRINHCSLHLPPFLSLPSLFLRIDRSCSLPDHSDNCSAYHSLFQPLRIILLPNRRAEDEQYQETCKHARSGSILAHRHTACSIGASSNLVHGRTYNCRYYSSGRMGRVCSPYASRRQSVRGFVWFYLMPD